MSVLLNYLDLLIFQGQGPSGKQVWHLITGCNLYVGSAPTVANTEDLSQYDPGC